jgi:enoyl-[acyl-carrier protein] reductase/trans-2-enoyl-CoA reductase (NAD+)
MIIKPKIRGFVCITAHPAGCSAHVNEQINYAKKHAKTSASAPKNVLVIGSSTGYGLASRIISSFANHAATLGICFERPAANGRPASAGWYNTAAFEQAAHEAGYYAKTINGDAFSDEVKQKTIQMIRDDLGSVDLVIYSLASPRRVDPKTGEIYKSTLKPIGAPFENKTIDTDKKVIHSIQLDPANDEEIESTRKVMGGEDWELWMDALDKAGVLAPGAQTVAYSYIGPKVTWPIYYQGTIGKAKEDLERACKAIDVSLQKQGGHAYVSVNKAVVTQASSAIPVVPLYISLLFKIMKEKGLHEDCIEQIQRLFNEHLYSEQGPSLDESGRIRIDDWEMRPEIQAAVAELWPQVTTENIDNISDFKGYQENFLKLFGFGLPGVNYEQEVDIDIPIQGVE